VHRSTDINILSPSSGRYLHLPGAEIHLLPVVLTCPFLVSCRINNTTFLPHANHIHFSVKPRLTKIRSFIQTKPGYCHFRCHCRHQIEDLSIQRKSITRFPSNDSNQILTWSRASTLYLPPPTNICLSLLQTTIEAFHSAGHCQPTNSYYIPSRTSPTMPRLKAIVPVLALSILSLFTQIAYAAPKPQAATPATTNPSSYWLASIQRSGTVAFAGAQTSSYPVYRDVSKYGAKGKSTSCHVE
jgi:hypothetical protein